MEYTRETQGLAERQYALLQPRIRPLPDQQLDGLSRAGDKRLPMTVTMFRKAGCDEILDQCNVDSDMQREVVGKLAILNRCQLLRSMPVVYRWKSVLGR